MEALQTETEMVMETLVIKTVKITEIVIQEMSMEMLTETLI